MTVLGHRGIHRVDNISGKPTTSIHVYGRDIGHAERHSYDPVTGEISRFVSGYCNVSETQNDSRRGQFSPGANSFKPALRCLSVA
ncbi:hypothetical protein E6H19_09155 [Candidatus Bathyarchaeota archaeon]|nr:MAG: hypothetical protein E6H19_09155 [Candidatus Bathyarchaeota archaeon]